MSPPESGSAAGTRSKAWALLPTACAIHCLVTPIAVAILPFFGWLDTIEPALFGISAVIGATEARSGTQVHGRMAVWIPVVLGIFLWGAELAEVVEAPWLETGMAVAGGLLIAGGLFWNGRLRHRVECARECACPAPH